MRLSALSFLLILPFVGMAQQKNVFHDRSFWKESTSVELVKQEIEKGSDPVALNSNAFDATVNAILGNAPYETISYLLSHEGNEVNKPTHDGRTYLMWAAYKGNIQLMKHLIEKGADMDIVGDHGNTVMTFAAAGGIQDTDVYDLLLAHGKDIDDATRSGATALHVLAPKLKDTQLISYFQEKGFDIHTTDKAGNNLFNYAARGGNIDMMNALIEMGLDYKGLNKKGGNAMMFASQGSRGKYNSLAVFTYLDSLGVETDIVTYEGETPLHNLARGCKDEAVLDYFVNKCVNINQIDKEGNTAFLRAIGGGNLAIAKKFAPMVKDINHVNEDGFSALTYAVRRNSTESIEYLLSQGADIQVLDAKGRNLVFHTFDSYNSRNSKAFENFLTLAKKKGLDLTPTYEGGNTWAHMAVAEGKKDLFEKAMELGVDINQKNKNGLTPLHLAAMKAKNKEWLDLLISKGADKTILTDFEESAYDLASENEALSGNGVDLGFLKID